MKLAVVVSGDIFTLQRTQARCHRDREGRPRDGVRRLRNQGAGGEERRRGGGGGGLTRPVEQDPCSSPRGSEEISAQNAFDKKMH